jgi:hypothetical protein
MKTNKACVKRSIMHKYIKIKNYETFVDKTFVDEEMRD